VECLPVRGARHLMLGTVDRPECDDRSVRGTSIRATRAADLARFSDLPCDERALDRSRAREEPEIGDDPPATVRDFTAPTRIRRRMVDSTQEGFTIPGATIFRVGRRRATGPGEETVPGSPPRIAAHTIWRQRPVSFSTISKLTAHTDIADRRATAHNSGCPSSTP
jgi:hypothetical protein